MAAVNLQKIVNVDAFPIHEPKGSALEAIIHQLHLQLQQYGVALLPNFMSKEAVNEALKDIEKSKVVPYRGECYHNVYLESNESEDGKLELEVDYPNFFALRSCKTCFTHDQIEPSSPLNQLYSAQEMTDFIRRILGKVKLYRTADTLGALNVHKYLEGDELGWHFDRGEFAVTLLLQAAEDGGHFEFYSELRSDENPNFDKVKEILKASQAGKNLEDLGIQTSHMAPGTLMVFCGHHSMHRVTPIIGSQPRYLAVLSYDLQPGVCLNDYTRMKFFGRLK